MSIESAPERFRSGCAALRNCCFLSSNSFHPSFEHFGDKQDVRKINCSTVEACAAGGFSVRVEQGSLGSPR